MGGVAVVRVGDGWLRTGVAARKAAISSEYVRYLVAHGRLKAIKTPLGLLIDPASVDAWVAEREARQA